MANLTTLAARILAAIDRETKRLRTSAKADVQGAYLDRCRAAGRNLVAEEVESVGVRLASAWPTSCESHRRAASRAVEKLAELGLVTRHGYEGGRLTHCKLTADGESLLRPRNVRKTARQGVATAEACLLP